MSNWVVRRSLNGGTTWTTVDRFGAEPAPSGIGNATARGITVTASGKVFVTGITPAPARLLVRKGTTGSSGVMTWVTSDDLSGDLPAESFGNAIARDGFGNVFTAGKGLIDGNDTGHFLVRKLPGQ